MYNIATLQECLTGLVGFRAVYNPQLVDYPDALKTSASGLYVQDVHKLINDDNIDASLPNFDLIDAPNAQANRDTFLTNIVQEALNNVIHKLVNTDKVAKTVQEKFTLWDGQHRYNQRRVKQDKFVGYKVTLKSQQGLQAVINKIGFLAASDNQHLDIYVYHTSNLVEPLYTFRINAIEARIFRWHNYFLADKVLPYLGANESGGSFIIGYYENELIGQTFKTDYLFGKNPCRSCVGDARYSNWHTRKKFMEVDSVTYSVDGTLIDLESEACCTDTFGLNIDFSTTCDISEVLCTQQMLFAKAVQNEIGIALLNHFAYSTRDNNLSLEVKQMAISELNGMRDMGLVGMIENQMKTIEGLSFDFSGLDSVCLPCKKAVRIGRA